MQADDDRDNLFHPFARRVMGSVDQRRFAGAAWSGDEAASTLDASVQISDHLLGQYRFGIAHRSLRPAARRRRDLLSRGYIKAIFTEVQAVATYRLIHGRKLFLGRRCLGGRRPQSYL